MEANPARSAGITPGRRTISLNGAAGSGAFLGGRDQLGDALRVGPDVQSEHEGDQRKHTCSQPRNRQDAGIELVLAGEDRAEDGGARIAPTTAPLRTYAIARAPLGGIHVSGSGADEEETPPDDPISANPTITGTACSVAVPRAVSA